MFRNINTVSPIVVVDDDPVCLQACVAFAKSEGLQVHACSNASQAIEAAAALQDFLLLVDWDLAGDNGLALFRLLRQKQPTSRIHCVLMSNYQGERFYDAAMRSGIDQFLEKPLSQSRVVAAFLTGFQSINLQAELRELKQVIPQRVDQLYSDLVTLRRLQAAQMPRQGEQRGGVQMHLFSKPRFIVSGDQACFFELNENQTAFALVDVVGHGIASAIRALGVGRLLSTSVSESIVYERLGAGKTRTQMPRSPAEVLNVLNAIYQLSDEDSSYFCLIYGVYHRDKGVIQFANAGMPRPLLQHGKDGLEPLGEGDVPIGLLPGHTYAQVEVKVRPNERLLLFSDGLLEALSPSLEQFDYQRLQDSLTACADKTPLEQIDCTLDRIEAWTNQSVEELSDDATVLTLTFGEAPEQNESAPERFEEILPTSWEKFYPALSGHVTHAQVSQLLVVAKVADYKLAKVVIESVARYSGVDVCVVAPDVFLDTKSSFLSANSIVFHLEPSGKKQLSKWYYFLSEMFGYERPIILAAHNATSKGEFRDAVMEFTDDSFALPLRQEELSLHLYSCQRAHHLKAEVLARRLQLQSLSESIDQEMQQVAQMQWLSMQRGLRQTLGVSKAVLYEPAQWVSGDFLSARSIAANKIVFYVMDTQGQGIIAATRGWAVARILAGVNRSGDSDELNKAQGFDISDPAATLRFINQRILSFHPKYQFKCAIGYGVLHTDSGHLSLCLAGMPPAVIREANGKQRLMESCFPKVGQPMESDLTNMVTVLRPGDTLMLYSDGAYQNAGLASGDGSLSANWLRYLESALSGGVDRAVRLLKQDADKHLRLTGVPRRDASALVLTLGSATAIEAVDLSVMDFLQVYQPLVQHTAKLGFIPQFAKMYSFVPEPGKAVAVTGLVMDLLERQAIAEQIRYAASLSLMELLTNLERHGAKVEGRDVLVNANVMVADGRLCLVIEDNFSPLPDGALLSARRKAFDAFDVNMAPEGGLGMGLVTCQAKAWHYQIEEDVNRFVLFFD